MGKRGSINFISQNEEAEGGLAVLAMLANYWGHEYDLTTLRRTYPVAGSRGMTISDLLGIAGDLQFETQVSQVQINAVNRLSKPCILQWEKNRFVIFQKFHNGMFHIIDPGQGERAIEIKEFATLYAGVAIEMRRKPGFKPTRGITELKLKMISKKMDGHIKSAGILMAMCSAIFMLNFIMPFYSMLVIDEVIGGKDAQLLKILFAAGMTVAILQASSEYLRDQFILFAGGQFTYFSNANLITHLLRLPMSYFETRHTSEILSRISAMDEIKRTLTEDLAKSVIDAIIVLATCGLLLLYSWELTAIVLGCSLVVAVNRLLCFNAYSDSQSQMFAAVAREQSCLMEMIRGIQSIKLYSIEAERFNLWNRIFSRKLNANLAGNRVQVRWQTFDSFVMGFEDIIILFVGALLVIDKSMTVGVLLAFISYKSQFATKFLAVLEQAFMFGMLKVHLERLSDILLQEKEEFPENEGEVTLSGSLEIKDLKFRYSASDNFLFNDLSVTIPPGDSIAIIGPSGCGKSTLLKIMLGLLDPHSGAITVDGHSIKSVKRDFRNAIATVMQDDCLLSGSILDNITFFDKNPDMDLVYQSAINACIHDDISTMPMGYQTFVSDFSSSISGGQKQRILIARSLYRQPKILFMDEATSALDVKNEKKVNAAMKHLGITRIIIAHRPETINSADKVYILSQGKMVLRTDPQQTYETHQAS